MISIKKLSLFSLLIIMGAGSAFGMESGKSTFSLFGKRKKHPKISASNPVTTTDKSVKLTTAFNTLVDDLDNIAEKIRDSTKKDTAKDFLNFKRNTYSDVIGLSSKLKSAIDEIYPILERKIGDKQQVSMVVNTLERDFGPSKLQSNIIQDMQADRLKKGFYELLLNAERGDPTYYKNLENEADQAFNNFGSKDVGTFFQSTNHPREKDIQTVPMEDIFKK